MDKTHNNVEAAIMNSLHHQVRKTQGIKVTTTSLRPVSPIPLVVVLKPPGDDLATACM